MALLGLVLGIWGVLDWRAIADTGRIQGTWKVVSARHDGIEVLSGDWNFTRFRFAGDRITLERWMNSYEGTFQLRSCSSKPCECDFSLYVHKWVHWSAWSLTRCSLARLKMGYGIYEFEGDHLRICIFLQNLDPVTSALSLVS